MITCRDTCPLEPTCEEMADFLDQIGHAMDELRALIDAHQPTLASRLLAAREKLDEIRAMVDATPAHFSAEQLAIVLAGIHDAAGLEPS